jgi:hypothetical protein
MMDGNYEWQKFRVNEKLQSHLRDAEAHRLAKQAGNSSMLAFSLKVALPLLIGLTVVVWFLTG